MTDLEKAERQALELEDMACRYEKDTTPEHISKAITAIKEALAQQPAQQQDIDWKDQYEKQKRRAEMWVAKYEADIKPLEKAGPVTAQQQEPVACVNGCQGFFKYSPPSKPWVGLTGEEIEVCLHHVDEDGISLFAFARDIEAKLKEKNNGAW